jgi:hypothetical protein
MKTHNIIPFSFLIIAALSSCQKEPFWGIRGKGSNTIETVTYKGFNRIELTFDANVHYTQDSVYGVEISAQGNIQQVIETSIDKEVLTFKASKKLLQHNPIEIIVHCPTIYGFRINGNGYINSENAITTSEMDLNVNGSGSISIPSLTADHVSADISGSGNIKADGGAAKIQTIHVSGSGKTDFSNMICNKSTIDVSGSGDMKVWITEELNVTISGSGMVSYKGSPTISSKISGSGKIIHL